MTGSIGQTASLFREIGSVLRPKSLAIVGASENGQWSKLIYDNLRQGGYPGRIDLINPRRKEVWGQTCYPDFGALPQPAEHAVVLVGTELVLPCLADGAAHGLSSALVFASGIGDGEEPESPGRAQALRELVAATGLRVCGPNCLGTVSVREKLALFPHPGMRLLRPGSVGAAFQSGGILQFWLQTFTERGGSISYAVSCGNEIDLGLPDVINFLVDDAETRVITLFIEGIRRSEALMAACARALAAGKPVIAMKIGRSQRGQIQAMSHTGAIGSDDASFDAFCRHYGVIRCHDLDVMNETVLAFSGGRLPRGRRIGVLVHSGGVKGLVLDEAETLGATLAELTPETVETIKTKVTPDVKLENPLDASMAAVMDRNCFVDICSAFAADPGVDILAINGVLPRGTGRRESPQDYRRILDSTEKPVIAFARMAYAVNETSRDFQDAAVMPFLQGVGATMHAIQALIAYSERASLPPPQPSAPSVVSTALPPEALRRALAEKGLPEPRSSVAATPADAAKAAAAIGFPVAIKILSPEISHKTEVGGVKLYLRSAEDVERAASELATAIRKAAPTATITGFLVQEMVRGVEVLLGAREDPLFGPILTIGSGGVLVELMRDVALRLLPITEGDIDALLPSLKLNKLLEGFRGAPPADVAALKRAILSFAEFYLAARGGIGEIEINPLIVRAEGGGVAAVDVRVIPREAERH